MELLCKLQKEKAVDIIRDSKTVMYKSGIWNEYSKIYTEDAAEKIINSPFGADVKINRETGIYYVCTPTQSDMW